MAGDMMFQPPTPCCLGFFQQYTHHCFYLFSLCVPTGNSMQAAMRSVSSKGSHVPCIVVPFAALSVGLTCLQTRLHPSWAAPGSSPRLRGSVLQELRPQRSLLQVDALRRSSLFPGAASESPRPGAPAHFCEECAPRSLQQPF